MRRADKRHCWSAVTVLAPFPGRAGRRTCSCPTRPPRTWSSSSWRWRRAGSPMTFWSPVRKARQEDAVRLQLIAKRMLRIISVRCISKGLPFSSSSSSRKKGLHSIRFGAIGGGGGEEEERSFCRKEKRRRGRKGRKTHLPAHPPARTSSKSQSASRKTFWHRKKGLIPFTFGAYPSMPLQFFSP